MLVLSLCGTAVLAVIVGLLDFSVLRYEVDLFGPYPCVAIFVTPTCYNYEVRIGDALSEFQVRAFTTISGTEKILSLSDCYSSTLVGMFRDTIM